MTRAKGPSACLLLAVLACAGGPPARTPEPAGARNVLLITIDTLRADRLGAYGHPGARTPAFDSLAARGTRFDRAYATAPITLTSHASMLSGRYPAGHGARHNGVRVTEGTPLVAEAFARSGFSTAAFVAAFPLDRRFGLGRGFQTYGDRMPRIAGRMANERSASLVTDEAIAWLAALKTDGQAGRFFLWVHYFEPHAPYGAAADTGPASDRYDAEIAEADRQMARLLDALGSARDSTLVAATADHGEAFGEHGEIAHSIFVYDTTLRVPLVFAGPGVGRHVIDTPVALIDLAPTIAAAAGVRGFDSDGIDLRPAFGGGTLSARTLYAESFAPLLDFGWSPLRSVRHEGWKVIDAPRPELYHVAEDRGEERDLAAAETARAADLGSRVQRYSPDTAAATATDPESAARLQSLGYVGAGTRGGKQRADPKDRRELAADIARVTSGELGGVRLEAVLRRILRTDPRNPQVHMRLGFVLQESNRCGEAVTHFGAAVASGIPGADAHLGLAGCHAAARRFDAAAAALRDAERAEPGNPVVLANQGIVLSDGGRPLQGIPLLQQALRIDPEFHEARFNLAVAFGRAGQRAEAAREAEELLRRLPAGAPQRPEIQRLLKAVQ